MQTHPFITLFGALTLALAAPAAAQTARTAQPSDQPASALEAQFRHPTGDARPWTLWYWMYGAVSDEGIRADLEAMASAGLGGAYIVTIRSSDDPRGRAYGGDSDQLTDNWLQRIRTAFAEADRHSYAAIRAARPDTAISHRALDEFITNCRTEKCLPQVSYIRSMKLNID